VPIDVNGDGYSDAVISARGWSRVYVFYGGATPDAEADLELVGPTDEAYFGARVAAAGDWNADGFGDFAVAPGDPTNNTVHLYLGAVAPSVEPFLTVDPPGTRSHFGWAMAGEADIDADGFSDLLAGASYMPGGGQVHAIFGGLDSSVAHDTVFSQGVPYDAVGTSVATGYLDGDRFGDVLVGAPSYSAADPPLAPHALVWLGGEPVDTDADATLTAAPDRAFGWRVAAGGDLDGDGLADFAVLEGLASTEPVPTTLWVYRGATPLDGGSPVRIDHAAGSNFGAALAFGNDLDGDGFDELLVGDDAADDASTGRVLVYGGGPTFDGVEDLVLVGPEPGSFGAAVAGRGDMNGDGRSDLLVSSPDAGDLGSGVVRIWFGPAGEAWSGSSPDLTCTAGGYLATFGCSVAF
jgi:hypothetical protein